MKRAIAGVLLVSMLLVSGCWDRTEINDLAFVSGAAFDLTKDGEYLLSLQIAIPSSSQGGVGSSDGEKEKFFVLSAVGNNANEAFEKLQKKSSRRLFPAHRSVIFIGEALARHGINDILDVFTHDPRQRLRTYIMVVKGGEGLDILEAKYPFEQVPIEAIKEMEALSSELAVTLGEFFMAASSPGISPVMGVIMSEGDSGGVKSGDKQLVKLAGLAFFKEMKVVGFLDSEETNGFLWLTDRMKYGRINAIISEGDVKGNVGMTLNSAHRKITTEVNGGAPKVRIQLQGVGSLVENNTRLDISRPNNLKLVQHALEQSVERQVRDVVAKLQKQYKVDSVGFGMDMYQNHYKQWKTLQPKWEQTFPEVKVAVDVQLALTGVGMAGPPLQLKEEEIVK
ncbi:Ger(x)C family spore germination protein [Paenibacillus koleovorans]|uniref:Ger(x)C family spore germination protein n=1 Tax=Paenibacillus koleovorans TaxID=121608 RepID=UPI000FD93252|nr:Ger(x)C family spore germination protein [Paenibacillus koleovorans]